MAWAWISIVVKWFLSQELPNDPHPGSQRRRPTSGPRLSGQFRRSCILYDPRVSTDQVAAGSIRVQAEVAHRFVAGLFEAATARAVDADLVAEVLVTADLRGISSLDRWEDGLGVEPTTS